MSLLDYITPFRGRIDDDVVWDSHIVVSNSARNEHVSQSETIRINWREIFGITANILYLRTLIFFGCIITHRNTYYWREMVRRTAKLCTFFFWGCVVTLTHTHLHQQRHARKHLERRLERWGAGVEYHFQEI